MKRIVNFLIALYLCGMVVRGFIVHVIKPSSSAENLATASTEAQPTPITKENKPYLNLAEFSNKAPADLLYDPAISKTFDKLVPPEARECVDHSFNLLRDPELLPDGSLHSEASGSSADDDIYGLIHLTKNGDFHLVVQCAKLTSNSHDSLVYFTNTVVGSKLPKKVAEWFGSLTNQPILVSNGEENITKTSADFAKNDLNITALSLTKQSSTHQIDSATLGNNPQSQQKTIAKEKKPFFNLASFNNKSPSDLLHDQIISETFDQLVPLEARKCVYDSFDFAGNLEFQADGALYHEASGHGFENYQCRLIYLTKSGDFHLVVQCHELASNSHEDLMYFTNAAVGSKLPQKVAEWLGSDSIDQQPILVSNGKNKISLSSKELATNNLRFDTVAIVDPSSASQEKRPAIGRNMQVQQAQSSDSRRTAANPSAYSPRPKTPLQLYAETATQMVTNQHYPPCAATVDIIKSIGNSLQYDSNNITPGQHMVYQKIEDDRMEKIAQILYKAPRVCQNY